MCLCERCSHESSRVKCDGFFFVHHAPLTVVIYTRTQQRRRGSTGSPKASFAGPNKKIDFVTSSNDLC